MNGVRSTDADNYLMAALRIGALLVLLSPAAALSLATGRSVAAVRVARPRLAASIVATADHTAAPRIASAYTAAKVATLATWSATSWIALSTHPTLALPLRHNLLTIAQALAPLPLGWGVFSALSSAARADGFKRLSSSTYRRLNLGAAAASLWMAAAVTFAPSFAVGYQMYTPPFALAAALAHILVGAFCLGVWTHTVSGSPKPVSGHYVPRMVRGLVGSLFALIPKQDADDPDEAAARSGRDLYALAAALFAFFTVMPLVRAFPLATVPTILGKRLSRAAAGWTFLSAVVCYVLKDAAQRGRLAASTFVTLRRTLAASSAIHLLVVAVKLIGVDAGGLILPGRGLWDFYPAAMSRPLTSAASLLMHILALFAALTPPASDADKGA